MKTPRVDELIETIIPFPSAELTCTEETIVALARQLEKELSQAKLVDAFRKKFFDEFKHTVYEVLEGFTLPPDARKILESAYYSPYGLLSSPEEYVKASESLQELAELNEELDLYSLTDNPLLKDNL